MSTDARYSHPNWYDEFPGVVRDQLPLPQVRLWQRETNQKPSFSSSVKTKKNPCFVPTFSAADFSTSESSPPFQIDETNYNRAKFQSRSNPTIGSYHSRNLPPLQRSRTVRSFFPASPVKYRLHKSRSVGDEFYSMSSNGADEDFVDYVSNGAIRSKSYGDLHRYESKFPPYEYFRERRRDPAHSPPQVPCRNSDSEVECRWNDETLPLPRRRFPREELLLRQSFHDRARSHREGHDAGTYYGYDSEYSGAETEVFLSDRSFDRSFSQENDSDQYISGPCDCEHGVRSYTQPTMTPVHLPILERISPDIPPREPMIHPRRLVRAKTEGSLLEYAKNRGRVANDKINTVVQFNTLPLSDSSGKKKKQVNFPLSSALKKSPTSSKPEAQKIRKTDQDQRHVKSKHHIEYRVVPPCDDDRSPQSTYIYESHGPHEEWCPGRFEEEYYDVYDRDESDQRYHRSKSSDRIREASIEVRRGDRCFVTPYDNDLPIPCGEPLSSPHYRDPQSLSLPMHSLNISKSSACPSVRKVIYTADSFGHPTDRCIRVPFPPKNASSHESSGVPLELQLNTRVRPSSSVSINEQPQYFEFDANSPPTKEYRVIADVDPSSDPASELSDRMSGYGASGGSFAGSGKRGTFARSLSTGEVPETEKTGGSCIHRRYCTICTASPAVTFSCHVLACRISLLAVALNVSAVLLY